jgi:hypothetical protein
VASLIVRPNTYYKTKIAQGGAECKREFAQLNWRLGLGTARIWSGLISEQFLQRLPGFVLARRFLSGRHKFPAGHFEVLTIIGEVLFGHRIGAIIPALLGDPRVVAGAIQTHLEVGVATRAGFGAPRPPGQFVFGAAVPTMSRQCHGANIAKPRWFGQPLALPPSRRLAAKSEWTSP